MEYLLRVYSQIEINPEDLDIPKSTAPTSTDVSNILNVVFAIAGGVAMLIIIFAGIQFMLSRGDPQKSATARNAVIYAAIGLAVTALAFTIVRFVIGSVG